MGKKKVSGGFKPKEKTEKQKEREFQLMAKSLVTSKSKKEKTKK